MIIVVEGSVPLNERKARDGADIPVNGYSAEHTMYVTFRCTILADESLNRKKSAE